MITMHTLLLAVETMGWSQEHLLFITSLDYCMISGLLMMIDNLAI